jgi:hypothetical protein
MGPPDRIVSFALDFEGEGMESTTASTQGKRRRRTLVTAILVLATILGILAVFGIWANRQALETDNWVETSDKLLEDEEISNALANYLVDELFTNVDVQAAVAAKLPPELQPLAGPITGGLRQAADTGAKEAFDRPRVEQLWEEANRRAHERFIQVVDGDAPDEDVTISLDTIAQQLGEQLGLDIADKLPPDTATLVVLPASDLSTAQDAVKVFKDLVLILTVLALALFALAVYLADGWRRQALRNVGFAFIFIGIFILVARSIGGSLVTDSLASSDSVQPAVNQTWTIGTSMLSEGAGAMILYGIVIVLGAWLAGPGGLATSARRAIAPLLHERTTAYASLLVLLLLLFWWAPTEGFRRLPISILIIALLVLGMEMLRKQALKDFPDETWDKASERWRNRTGLGT